MSGDPLKPCPFCDCTPSAQHASPGDEFSAETGASVVCVNPGCLTQVGAYDDDDLDKCIAAWNRRPPPIPASPEGEGLDDGAALAVGTAILDACETLAGKDDDALARGMARAAHAALRARSQTAGKGETEP